MTPVLHNPANEFPESVLRECVDALQQVANYRLSPAMNRRLLWLSENKDKLDVAEREELLTLIEFAEDRTLEKLRARAVLNRMGEVWPQLLASDS